MKNMREKQKYIQKVEITAIKNGKQYYEKSKEKKNERIWTKQILKSF